MSSVIGPAPAVSPAYQSILDQNEVLKAVRPELLAFAKRLDDGAERMSELASGVTGLQKTYAGSGDELAKVMDTMMGTVTHTKASMKKSADVSREIVAAIDQIVNAPLPSWITGGPSARSPRNGGVS